MYVGGEADTEFEPIPVEFAFVGKGALRFVVESGAGFYDHGPALHAMREARDLRDVEDLIAIGVL